MGSAASPGELGPVSGRQVDPGDLFEHAPLGYLCTRPDGMIIRANARFLEWAGCRAEDLCGRRRLTELLAPGARLFYETQLLPLLQLQGRVSEIGLDLVSASGALLPAVLSANVLPASDGRPLMVRVLVSEAAGRRAYEAQLRLARETAERLSHQSVLTSRRLEILAAATAALIDAAGHVPTALERFCASLVPALADYALVYLAAAEAPGGLLPSGAAHADPVMQETLRRAEALLPGHLSQTSLLRDVLRGGPPQLIREVTPALLSQALDNQELRDLTIQLGVSSVLAVPMVARGERIAVLVLLRGPSGEQYSDQDLVDAVDLGGRAGLALDNVLLHSRQHETAVTLQRSLLSPLPEIAGLALASAYLPGLSTAEVGGDWYDVLTLADGTTGVAIGDVMGHDLVAAAAMGQLRSVLRSYAWEGDPPVGVLARLNRLVLGLGLNQLATCFYGRLELPGPSGERLLTYANAGHLPPLLRRRDGSVETLDGAAGVLIGVESLLAEGPEEAAARLAPGEVLLLFTDGLVERRGHDLEEGIAQVRRILAEHDPGAGVGALLEAILAWRRGQPSEDDVCLLAVGN